VNPKQSIAYAHFAALNGAWLYDEVSCRALRVIGQITSFPGLGQDCGTGYLSDPPIAPPPAGSESQPSGLYRVFVVDDLNDEGRFWMVVDPWLPEFADAIFLSPSSFTVELDQKLKATSIHGSIPSTEWLRAIMSLREETARSILTDPRMADCPADYWSLSVMGAGVKLTTLAGWIDLWYGDEFVWICPDCGGRVFAYEGRSILSVGTLDGLCSACGHEVRERGHVSGRIMRGIEVLRRHRSLRPDLRPYRIDTVLARLGAANVPGSTGHLKGTLQ